MSFGFLHQNFSIPGNLSNLLLLYLHASSFLVSSTVHSRPKRVSGTDVKTMNGSCESLADVSTVGNRVRIRHRSGSNAASTNMSQSVKLLDNNPPSALKEDDVCNLKTTYGLSSSVTLRLPLSSERAADARPDEIVVYESYYAAGLREVVPSLIAQISTRLAISPGQLYPFAWRLLIAIQTFGELESITIGVEEVMYAYYFTKFEADPGRYSMHTRNHPPLAIDLKHHAKKSLEEAWRERYIFMKVGRNPGFPTSWFVAGGIGYVYTYHINLHI